MTFEKMEHAHLDRVCELEKECFLSAWNKEQCLYELDENPFSNGWILKAEDKIVGYAFLWETFEMAQLARIGIDKAYRGQGLGRFLLEKLCQRAKEAECEFMTLEVRASNASAIALYEHFDFVRVNISKGYYPDGEDALVYTKAL